MAALADYLANKWIDFLYRGVAFTPPAALYVALFTVTPADAGGGTEVSGGSYARVNLPPSPTNWSATNAAGSTANPSTGTSQTTSNNVTITFPTPTANWGTVVAAALFDAPTGGNLLTWGPLVSNQVVNSGNPFSFPPGSLSFQADN